MIKSHQLIKVVYTHESVILLSFLINKQDKEWQHKSDVGATDAIRQPTGD